LIDDADKELVKTFAEEIVDAPRKNVEIVEASMLDV
jgi:hypothetical protein